MTLNVRVLVSGRLSVLSLIFSKCSETHQQNGAPQWSGDRLQNTV